MNEINSGTDPFLMPQTTFISKAGRSLWGIVYFCFFFPSFRTMHSWRAFLLRCFGAQLGKHCRIYRRAKIWAPWNLHCDDVVFIADDAEIYNHALVTIGSHAVISQQAYICTGTHDINDSAFPLIAKPITIGARAWICARATVMPGTDVGVGAVLALGSVATHTLLPWTVYAGVPAKPIGVRQSQRP